MKDEKISFLGLSLLNAGWAKDDDRWNFGPICSTFMRIYWVTRGEACVIINGHEHHLRAGHFYLIPPLTTHYDRSQGEFKHYYLHVTDSSHTLENVFNHFDMSFEVDVNEVCSQFFVDIARDYPELKLPHPEPNTYEATYDLISSEQRFSRFPLSSQYQIKGMLLMLLSLFLKNATERHEVTSDRVKRTLSYIEQNISTPLPLTELAKSSSLSKEQFIRLFSSQVGTPPTAYIISRRIYHAQLLLAQNRRSVKEVAAQVGYDNFSYFCRIFRQYVGMSPREFKKQNT